MIPGMQRPYDERISKLLMLFPEGQRGLLRDFAEWLSVAEEEIARFKAQYPGQAEWFDGVFPHLWPTPPLRGKSPEIYRAHVAELLGRVALRSSPLVVPTSAELLYIVLATALIAPLSQNPAALAEWLFADVRKLNPAIGDLGLRPEDGAREAWPGAIREQLTVMRKKFRFERGGA